MSGEPDRRPPRNQLGQPATTTPAEAVARLEEKALKNHGTANRERIRHQISEELTLVSGPHGGS